MKVWSFLCVLAFSLNAFAISEKNYQNDFQNKVLPLIYSMSEGTLFSNNLNLHYRTLMQDGATSCLVILPGRSESAVKYGEMVYDLVNSEVGKKLNYFILDHRGQGSSERMASPHDMGHVDRFENYVSDLNNFLKTVVDQAPCGKKFLFAHSMGAGIGLSFVEREPQYFSGLMISSPMLKIQTAPYKYFVARAIIDAMMIAGKEEQFSIGQLAYNPNDRFENNRFTTSPNRFVMTMGLYELFPETQLGGVSNGWLNQVMKGTIALRKGYKKITVPMKLYRAGIELYTEPKEATKLCLQAAKCEELIFPSSKHEVFNDRDENRDQVIGSMIQFMTDLSDD